MRFNFITFCKKEKPKVTRRIPQLLLVVQEKEIHFFVAFETDSKKRNQMDRRYMKSMQTKMQEWYARTKLSALCFVFWKGQFWIATGLML
ncbi:uncharacterized protein [Pocillopora verrucosa]|uniref:uncharacterized protein isoform X3 n=1 Tax=Pocillopora verrucosa TaxID=203993 RepID=UPI003341AC14